MNFRRRDGLLGAAATGLEVWLSYGVVEYVLATTAPVLLHRAKLLDEGRWRGTVILFAGYAIFGILSGLFTGIGLQATGETRPAEFDRRSRKLLILLMVVIFGLNLLLQLGEAGKWAELLAVILVAAAVHFDVGKTESSSGLAGCAAATAAVLILTARLAMVNWKTFSLWMLVPITLVAAVVALGAAVLAIRMALLVRSRGFWTPGLKHALIVATVSGIIFGPGFVSSIYATRTMPAVRAAGGTPKPNVILISMDTVRADHLGIYGYARQTTPNLKELLKESSLYTNFMAASSITLTSHASMFTGLYPRSHGSFKQLPDYPEGRPLPGGHPTIASVLDSAGYCSMALAANIWYLGPDWGLLRGFEYSWIPVPQPLVESNHPYLLRGRIGELMQNQTVASDFYSSPFVDADAITDRATTLIDRFTNQQAPFFLFLNYMDAHWPYHSPAPYDSAYPGRDSHFNGTDDEAAMRTKVVCEGEAVPSGYQAHSESQYDGAIAFIDFKIGELVQHLKQNGLYDNTLLIITADHGETFGERNWLGHNVSVYSDQIHVPLVVKYPGKRQPGRVDSLASHVDLLPTIVDVAGLAPVPDLPGVSLLRLDSKPDRVVFSERHNGPCLTASNPFLGVQYAVMQGTHKMVVSPNGSKEAYDLSSDPNEKTNLYKTNQAWALDGAFQDWIKATPAFREGQQRLDPQQLKKLRSLGYLQ